MKDKGYDSASLFVMAASSLKYYPHTKRPLLEGYEYLNDFTFKTIVNASPDDLEDFIDKAGDIKRNCSLFFLTLARPSFISLIDSIYQKLDVSSIDKSKSKANDIFDKLHMFFYPQAKYNFNLKEGQPIDLIGFNNIAHYFIYFQEYSIRDPMINLDRNIPERDLFKARNIYDDALSRYSNYLYFINKFDKQLELEKNFNFKLPPVDNFCATVDWDNLQAVVHWSATSHNKEGEVLNSLKNYWLAAYEQKKINESLPKTNGDKSILKI